MKFSNQKCIKVFLRLLSQPKNSQILLYVQNLIFFLNITCKILCYFGIFAWFLHAFLQNTMIKMQNSNFQKRSWVFLRKKLIIQSNLVIRNVLLRNKLISRNHFPWPNANLLHKDQEHLSLRNNFSVTKKFLIAKFDCSSYLFFVLQLEI